MSACGSFWSESPGSKCSVAEIPLYLFEKNSSKMKSQKTYFKLQDWSFNFKLCVRRFKEKPIS